MVARSVELKVDVSLLDVELLLLVESLVAVELPLVLLDELLLFLASRSCCSSWEEDPPNPLIIMHLR
jgi:hypothetical protein